MKKKVVQFDPSVPFVEVALGDKVYRLVFTFGALADAEMRFVSEGHHEVMILAALPSPFLLRNTKILFACALNYYHPELTYEQACELVTLQAAERIALAIAECYRKSMPDPEPEAGDANPPQPGDEAGSSSGESSGPTPA